MSALLYEKIHLAKYTVYIYIDIFVFIHPSKLFLSKIGLKMQACNIT